MTAVGPLVVYGGVLFALSGCLAFPPKRDTVSFERRVDMFPVRDGRPLFGDVTVYWGPEQTPFIEASDDRDLPFALGMVMAHQRLAQMEVLRRASQARLSEMAGPIAGFIDETLRALDFGKAAQASWEKTRPDTRAYLERFVAGINAYRARVKERPADYVALGFGEEEWTPLDVLTIGRLGSTDINWSLWYTLLRMRGEPKWPEVLERVQGYGLGAVPSFGPPTEQNPLNVLEGLSKSGSNTFVVRGEKTTTGAGLIANDPHVGLNLPNLWMVVGIKSPSVHAVGMMLPGVPGVLLGRNDKIGFGGTNMRGLSTAMFDASKFTAEEITTRTVEIKRRWWVPKRVTVRDTPRGPIMTDTPLFSSARENGVPVAFAWRGHEPSDELSAILDMNKAGNFEEFRQSFATWAVSGQNFLYTDIEGNIGQVLALEYDPVAGRAAVLGGADGGTGGVADPSDPLMQWGKERVTSTQLPFAYNPEAGFLVSANNTPVRTEPPVTLTANGDSRIVRISELVTQATSEGAKIDAARAAEIQMDVYSLESHEAAKAVAARGKGLTLSEKGARALGLVEGWDGRYVVESVGAPVAQAVLFRTAKDLYTRMYGEKLGGYLVGADPVYRLLAEDIAAGRADVELAAALESAGRDVRQGTTWGDRHKLRVTHYLGNLPVIGAAWRWGEFGVNGSLKTVFKTANDLTDERHRATYGANARHVSDLSDMDKNTFVLLGGQDGWIGSANMLDQVEAWRTGQSFTVPMRMESVRKWAKGRSELRAGIKALRDQGIKGQGRGRGSGGGE